MPPGYVFEAGFTKEFCGGNFPKPETTETKEKECCGRCGGAAGCGHGPAKEGSVQDASGAGLLQEETKSSASVFCYVAAPEGEFIVDVVASGQTPYFKEEIASQLLALLERYDPDLYFPRYGVLVLARKIGDYGLKTHFITFSRARISSWAALSHLMFEVAEGIV